MALNFPSNPTVNQVYESGTTNWKFDGAIWMPVVADPLATRVTVTPSGTITSTTVQSAIEEIDNDLVSLKYNINFYAGELSFLYLEMIKAMPGLQGYWPADPAYIYQDSAGYIPATVNGVVGQVRDISNAATPVARRNLLTYTETFAGAGFFGEGTTITPNVETAPDGTLSADRFLWQLPTYVGYFTVSLSGTYTFSIWAKGVVGGEGLYLQSAPSGERQTYTLTNQWQRYSFTYTGSWTRADFALGNVNDEAYLWGAQLEVGGEATPYQKIVTGTGEVFAPGNHAYQTTTANKPYLRVTPTSGVHWLDSNTSTSGLTATLGNLGASCTVARAGAEGVTFTEGVTISSTYNIAPTFGFNGDVAIFNRALTVTEKALLTRYMQRGVPVLGSNLVTNGTFDTDTTGWIVVNGTLSVESGKMRITNTGAAYGLAGQAKSVSSGTPFLLRGDPYNGTNTGATVKVSNTNGGTAYVSVTTPGASSAFVATASTIYPYCISSNFSNGYADYDNISLQAIL